MEHVLPLAGWENFYVIVGSSAAALTGLQFVVITLINSDLAMESNSAVINTFSTPTVVHFCAVLVGSAILSAPWNDLSGAALALGGLSVFGVAYAALTLLRARKQTTYQPVLEDWIFHFALPVAAYTSMLGASLELPSHSRASLFMVALDLLVLLLTGIHNAWDAVIYVGIERRKKS